MGFVTDCPGQSAARLPELQRSVPDRTRWPLWLAAVFLLALAATGWPSSDDAAMTVPTPLLASAPTAVAGLAPPAGIAPKAVAAAAKPVGGAPPASAFRLVGTVLAANGTESFALVRRAADSKLLQLRAGDRLEGLTVRAIRSDAVVLAGAEQAIVIEADPVAASPVPSGASSTSRSPDVEPAWAGDPAPFGH